MCKIKNKINTYIGIELCKRGTLCFKVSSLKKFIYVEYSTYYHNQYGMDRYDLKLKIEGEYFIFNSINIFKKNNGEIGVLIDNPELVKKLLLIKNMLPYIYIKIFGKTYTLDNILNMGLKK